MFVDQLAGLPNDDDLEREIQAASGETGAESSDSPPAPPPPSTRKPSGWK
jgi:hypothetical protein